MASAAQLLLCLRFLLHLLLLPPYLRPPAPSEPRPPWAGNTNTKVPRGNPRAAPSRAHCVRRSLRTKPSHEELEGIPAPRTSSRGTRAHEAPNAKGEPSLTPPLSYPSKYRALLRSSSRTNRKHACLLRQPRHPTPKMIPRVDQSPRTRSRALQVSSSRILYYSPTDGDPALHPPPGSPPDLSSGPHVGIILPNPLLLRDSTSEGSAL
ncbi:hypothetical protein KM043_009249 [Ampulex compressa]|nr:hypothetical protein KM043_009249 [Ampulex compressa]